MSVSPFTEQQAAAFADFESAIPSDKHSALHAKRRSALARFAEAPMPTFKNEEWKFTSVRSIAEGNFAQADATKSDASLEALIPKWNGPMAVFVNGFFRAEYSTLPVAKGITVLPLSQAITERGDLLDSELAAQSSGVRETLFEALNTAFVREGLFLHAAKGAVLEAPILILHIGDYRTAPVLYQPRNLFLVESNAQATVLEQFVTLGDKPGLCNTVSEVRVAGEGHFSYHRLQTEGENAKHISAIEASQGKNSHFESSSLSFTGGLVRNDLRISLNGERTETRLHGLFLLAGKTHVDNHTLIDHREPNSTSDQHYKGILDDYSTGVFNGKIYVQQKAQKTAAFQSNNNLLLSNNATLHTKPQLEIWADDVKCTHGATSGQLDEEALFYLRARGLDQKQAKGLLLYAFAGEVIDRIASKPVQDYVRQYIEQGLAPTR